MSTDYTVVCDECMVYRHLGQYMGGTYSFGYGSKDTEGAQLASKFISDHIYHAIAFKELHVPGLRIVKTDDIPLDYTDAEDGEYKEI